MFKPTLAQDQTAVWIDILLQAGILATFIVFAVAMVFIKLGLSKKPSDSSDHPPE